MFYRCSTILSTLVKEKIEDTKGVIRIRKSKDRSKTVLLFSITKYKINQDRYYVTTKLDVNRRIDQRQVYFFQLLSKKLTKTVIMSQQN